MISADINRTPWIAALHRRSWPWTQKSLHTWKLCGIALRFRSVGDWRLKRIGPFRRQVTSRVVGPSLMVGSWFQWTGQFDGTMRFTSRHLLANAILSDLSIPRRIVSLLAARPSIPAWIHSKRRCLHERVLEHWKSDGSR